MTAPADNRRPEPGAEGRSDAARRIFAVLLGLCAVLGLIDVVNLATHWIHKHPYFELEYLPNFYGFYGLAACLVMALAARWLGRVLGRDKDYYDDAVD